jgi:nucleotidyltransferase/DNA polymerase involved in DNA repair
MRIACIHLPSLPLQAFLRLTPRWIGSPVATVDHPLAGRLAQSGRRVTACSRAAWALGVRPGMTALAAHEIAPSLIQAPVGDGSLERATLDALADALLAVTPTIDLGGAPTGTNHAIYVEVPARTRGATFGARVLEVVEAQGLRARVGIADDRFTAWVAASAGGENDTVVTVPRGGAAAFLAPLPLSLLAIPPEVQHVLEALGIRTLGAFAELPPPSPSVASAPSWDGDYQALARGDGATYLRAHAPAARLLERVEVGGDVSIGAALDRAARRIASRLAGRGQAAAKLLVRAGSSHGLGELDVPLAAPIADAADLADAIGRVLHGDAAFVEVDVPVAVPASGGEVPAAQSRDQIGLDGVPSVVPREASAPLAAAAEPPVFRLTPQAPVLQMSAQLPHRRTRGKNRTRATVAAQARLFRT